MALKAVKPEEQEKVMELLNKCSEIDTQIFQLQQEKIKLQEEILEIKIAPFKIGDYAYADIPSGRSVKNQKCLLECGNGTLYLRPVTKNGELSGRHFSCVSITKPYSELLKKVEV